MAASPPTCRRRIGCGLCAARLPRERSKASRRLTAHGSSPPPTSKASSRSRRCCTSSTTSRSASRSLRRRSALRRRAGRRRDRRERGRGRGYRRPGRALDRRRRSRWSIRTMRSPTARRTIHAVAPGNVIVEGRIATPDFEKALNGAAKRIVVRQRARAGRTRRRWKARAGHAAYDIATGRVTLTCTTQMPHLTRTAIADMLGMPESDLRVVAPDVGGGFGQKMSLGAGIRAAGLARASSIAASFAWTEDRRENLIAALSQPRPVCAARRRVRRRRQADRARRRHHRQYRRLFVLPDHLRRRAADGDGGDAGALRLPRLSLRTRAASSPTPARWRPIAACRGRSSPLRWSG